MEGLQQTATIGGVTNPSFMGGTVTAGVDAPRKPLEEELVHHLFSRCPSLQFSSP